MSVHVRVERAYWCLFLFDNKNSGDCRVFTIFSGQQAVLWVPKGKKVKTRGNLDVTWMGIFGTFPFFFLDVLRS